MFKRSLFLFIFCLTGLLLSAQEVLVSGKIIDDRGDIVNEAFIKVVESKQFATSNNRGAFILKLLPGDYTIIITATGHKSEQKLITIDSLSNDIGEIVIFRKTQNSSLLSHGPLVLP